MTTTLSSSSSGPVYGSLENTSSAAAATRPDCKRVEQRLLVDELAARGVDDADALLRVRQRLRVHHGARLVGEGQVERDDVRLTRTRPPATQPSPRRARGSARGRRTDRTRARACRGPAPAAPPAGRYDRSRARRASFPRAPGRRSATAPSARLLTEACACAMFLDSASMSPIVCSAAEMTVDSGAFTTRIPRRVASPTSMLSTPTPARPITRRLVARSSSSASSFVCERMTIAS